MIRRAIAVALMVSAALPAWLSAQLRADPGTVINGRVAVRVYVTLADDETSYAPIGGVRLRFFRTTADTVVVVRTDDAGTATALLLPGEYRLMSTSPVDWKGARYSWNQLVAVRAGIPTIELTAAGAERVAIVATAAAPGSPTPVNPGVVAYNGDARVRVTKDPAMATMLSFFLPGSGQMYGGERVKGGALLALAAVGGAVAGHALSCASATDCEMSNGGRALGAAGMLAFFGSWVYGIVDAGDSARRFNDRAAVVASAARPIIEPDGRGRIRLGASLRLGR
jgi:hypothetical protein